jgi:3-oxoacyl-[acyl-carrier protein] reductase
MLTTDLKPHLALITGATGGIGKATCQALASLGCSIAVHYNTSPSAQDLVDSLRSKGVRAEAFQADLTKYSEVRRLHAAVVKKMGNPTILYNNAGLTLGKHGLSKVEEITIDEFEETWRANCGSAYLLTQLCMPAMEEKGWGRVIFCSSVAGFIGGVVGPHYASSKSALHGLIHWLSQFYAKKGITVNGIAPALIEGTAMLPGSNEELKKSIFFDPLRYEILY